MSSPKRERYKELLKEHTWRRLSFPVFTKSEIDECARVCFPALLETPEGAAGIQERYVRLGGVPRYVIANLNGGAQKLQFDVLGEATVRKLERSVSVNGIEAVSTEDVVHIKAVGEDQTRPSIPTTSDSTTMCGRSWPPPSLFEKCMTVL